MSHPSIRVALPWLMVCAAVFWPAGNVLAREPPALRAVSGPYAKVDPLETTVRGRILPQVEALVNKLLAQRRDLAVDGVRVFEQGDRFLPGKIAAIMAYRITSLEPGDPRLPERLAQFSDIAELTLMDANDSWGIYYYLSALDTLRQAGLLERALNPKTLVALRSQLDWRRFVRPDYTLISLPNNYYGVAFAVSRLRHRLGWEDTAASEALLKRTIAHYRTYSGQFGFADETDGDGRFDRYSVLLIAEIGQRLAETDTPVPPEVRQWLKGSAKLALLRMNLRGEGWEYGRSIGAYGDTALLEVLAVAARLKVLTPLEQRMAYAFSARVAARYVDFWIDPTTGSVNLWDGGRRTDAYRGKHRIFGENLSLARQYFYTSSIWNELGYRGAAPDPAFGAYLQTLSVSTMTWFARGQFDRALVTMRDRGMVLSLPVISGARDLHRTNPYYPVPFSPGVLMGTADGTYPQLTPRLRLADGSVLMPLAYFQHLRVRQSGPVTTLSWQQDGWDRVDGAEPTRDARLASHTRYTFAPGKIVREDDIELRAAPSGADLDIEFAGFSTRPSQSAEGDIAFGDGAVTHFSSNGYGACAFRPAEASYAAPVGELRTVVACRRSVPGGRINLRWELSYDPAKR